MKKIIFLIIVLVTSTKLANAQFDYTPYPYPLNNPSIIQTYTATQSCSTPTWEITNGGIRKVDAQAGAITWVSSLTANSVDIRWDDVTAKGKLKATTICGSGQEAQTLTVEKEFPICSLTGLNLQGAFMGVNWNNLAPCETVSSFQLSVNPLFMTWTGGVNGSPMERADGYEMDYILKSKTA